MRRSLRVILAVIVTLVSALASALPAAAAWNWCEDDPVFSVGGNAIDVTTTFSGAYLDSITGPVSYELLVPSNAILPAVVSLSGSTPMRATISRTLAPAYGLFGMPAVLRMTIPTTTSFTTYTRVTGVTRWGWGLTLLNTVAGSSTSVQEYAFTLPLY